MMPEAIHDRFEFSTRSTGSGRCDRPERCRGGQSRRCGTAGRSGATAARLRGGLAACALMLLAAAGPAAAADIYVDAAFGGAEQGTMAAPYRTVQAAIDAAQDGDRIRVAAGTYTENLRIETKGLVLEGGYGADGGRDIAKNVTTLAGAGGNAVINLIASDSTIDGFTITGGVGSTEDLPYSRHGGGIYSRAGSPVISNNIITGHDLRAVNPPSETNFGGGIYIANAPAAVIRGNTIGQNVAGRGAGIAITGESALIEGNTVEDNTSVGDHGGGLYVAVVDAVITGNIIRRNEIGRELGYGWGGGLIVYNTGNSAELSFNEVYENFAAAYGAGEFIDEGATARLHHELIYGNVSKEGCEAVSAIAVDGGATGGSTVTIEHCTVVDNVCPNATRGNGLQVEDKSVVRVSSSIFWGNGGDDFSTDGTVVLDVTFTASEEPIAGVGNITKDPRFAKPSTRDYRLAAGSPCIDAADPALPFDKEPAGGMRADMGCFGNTAEAGAASGAPAGNGGGDDDDDSDDGVGDADDTDDVTGPGNGQIDLGKNGCGAFGPMLAPACAGLCMIGSRRRGRSGRRK